MRILVDDLSVSRSRLLIRRRHALRVIHLDGYENHGQAISGSGRAVDEPGDHIGHAEQNLMNFLNRRSWMPSHGAASRSVCSDFCAPLIRSGEGRMDGPVHQKESGTKQRQFYWP